MREIEFKFYRATADIKERLKNLKESGMGYQKIKTDNSGEYYVFNGEYLLPLAKLDDFLRYIIENSIKSFEGIKPILEDFLTDLDGMELMDGGQKKIKVCASTEKNQAFYRFSAFENDFRLNSKGDFMPGTYATSYNDIRLVPSGLSAVGRYALPNPFSANYVHILMPKKDTNIEISTVSPGNGQSGGGIEVYFPSGGNFEYSAYRISEF